MPRPTGRRALEFTVIVALGLGSLLACAPAEAPPPAEPAPPPAISDALAPTGSGDGAPIRQLHTVTLCTSDMKAIRAFYVDAMGLRLRGPLALSDQARAIERALWGIPEDVGWELFLLDRPVAPGTIQIRVLALERETPLIHSSWGPIEPGPFSMGFPTTDLETWDPELRERGYESLMPLSSYRIPRPDGTTYGIQETIFNAPDFVHAVTISRRDGMPQLGPVDPVTGRGGPVYSAQVIEHSDDVLAFYVDVLGLELRSDRQFRSSGSKGALGVPDGTEFRFSIVYSGGASFGHLLFLDFQGRLGVERPDVEPRPPNRGLAMWTFPVPDLDAMLERLDAAGVEPFAGPTELDSPSLGRHRALTVLDPGGFMVELFETVE